MTLVEYALFAFSSLFVIVDPIAAVPAFLAMTARDSPAERLRTARVACTVAVGLLAGFAFIGQRLFTLLGVTLPAFQVAGALVLLLVALDMLRAQRSAVQETEVERAAGRDKDDIAVTPLAMPMLAGPGAISTVILLESQARNWSQRAVLLGCLMLVGVTSYATLALAGTGARRLSPIAERIITRLMGLILAAVAVQFMFNALKHEGGLLGK
ncbi:MAG TPA: MarC family protein [Nitrospiraceae bacterium]|jgi:multiple antibiotic resistance protein|nr:MarC family protein [Nitrospiraceae bacterium]